MKEKKVNENIGEDSANKPITEALDQSAACTAKVKSIRYYLSHQEGLASQSFLNVNARNGTPNHQVPVNLSDTRMRRKNPNEDEEEINIATSVVRPVYTESQFDEGFEPRPPRIKSFFDKLGLRNCYKCSCIEFLVSFIPILAWLPKYDRRQNLGGDIAAGLTVGIMQIPQGVLINFAFECVCALILFMLYGERPVITIYD